MIETWIAQSRHRTCAGCTRVRECERVPGRLASLFAEQTLCPASLHPSRAEAIAARAWPAGIPPVSGCCDRAG